MQPEYTKIIIPYEKINRKFCTKFYIWISGYIWLTNATLLSLRMIYLRRHKFFCKIFIFFIQCCCVRNWRVLICFRQITIQFYCSNCTILSTSYVHADFSWLFELDFHKKRGLERNNFILNFLFILLIARSGCTRTSYSWEYEIWML